MAIWNVFDFFRGKEFRFVRALQAELEDYLKSKACVEVVNFNLLW